MLIAINASVVNEEQRAEIRDSLNPVLSSLTASASGDQGTFVSSVHEVGVGALNADDVRLSASADSLSTLGQSINACQSLRASMLQTSMSQLRAMCENVQRQQQEQVRDIQTQK